MDEVPAAATTQGSPIAVHGSPQHSNDENAGKRAERDRALDEIHAGITELSEFYATRDRVDREAERLVTRKGGSNNGEKEIDEDIGDLVKQLLASLDKEIEEGRIRWQAKQRRPR